MAAQKPLIGESSTATATAATAAPTATASPTGTPGSQPVAASRSTASSVGVGAQQHQQQSKSRLHQFPLELNPLLFSCLDIRSLAQLHKSDRTHRDSLASTMAEKKTVSEELLPQIFNANPKGIAEFFAKPGALKKMILTQTYGREGYRNQKNEFIPTRHWGWVSPLQAAAKSGDNFILMQLLSILLEKAPAAQKISDLQVQEDELHRVEALRQLLEVIHRVKAEPPVETGQRLAATPAPSAVPTVGTASATATASPAPAPAPATATAIAAAASTRDGDRKVTEERKETAENTNVVFADAAPCLAPFIELIKALKVFINNSRKLAEQENWDAIASLWGTIGECQKKLSRYGLQEFCDNKPSQPIPAFDKAPDRADCCSIDGKPLVLEHIGIDTRGTRFVLMKSTRRGAALVPLWGPGGWQAVMEGPILLPPQSRPPGLTRTQILLDLLDLHIVMAWHDLASINRLYEHRRTELGNIINALQKSEKAQILVQTWTLEESLAFLRTPLSQPKPVRTLHKVG